MEHRDPAGNGVVGPIVHGDSVVVGHRLPLNGQPAAAAVAQQSAVVIKFIDGIKSQVDIALAVIIEQIQLQGLYQPPLLLAQAQYWYAVRTGAPGQIFLRKPVLGEVLLRILHVQTSAAQKPAQQGADILGGDPAVSAQHTQQRGQRRI